MALDHGFAAEHATRLLANRGTYRCRWLIEEFHKGLKTGAGLERSPRRDVRQPMAWGSVLEQRAPCYSAGGQFELLSGHGTFADTDA